MTDDKSPTSHTARHFTTLTTPAGDTVAFDRYGPPGAPAALFIAGAGPTRADDAGTTETAGLIAERDFQASVHDRIGRGDSAASGPISLERELQAIAAIADHLGGPVVLVGHSSGCAIAIEAADRVEQLAGLVLWEAPIGQFTEGAPKWWRAVEEAIEQGRLEDAVADYMVDMPPEWIEGLKQSPAYPDLIHSWIADGTALANVESAGLEASLQGVNGPVLAVVGTETFPGMAATAAQIAEAAPNGSAEKVKGAWHSWDEAAMAERLISVLEAKGLLRARSGWKTS